MTLFNAPTANFIQTTLNGAITNSQTTITLNSVASLQTPGYIVIDRTDSNGNSTPSAREVVYYTGISGSQLTGCTRGADGSTAQAHNSGAVVETMPTIGMWNSLTTVVATGFDGQGLLNAIVSPVTIAYAHLVQMDLSSIASIQNSFLTNSIIGNATITGLLGASGASITGLGFSPVFVGSGSYSGATAAIGGLVIAPRAGTLQWVAAMTKYVASGASVSFDFKVRGTSVLANPTITLMIPAGGTFVSSASIGTKNVNMGDIIQADLSAMVPTGLITEITVQAGTV